MPRYLLDNDALGLMALFWTVVKDELGPLAVPEEEDEGSVADVTMVARCPRLDRERVEANSLWNDALLGVGASSVALDPLTTSTCCLPCVGRKPILTGAGRWLGDG